MPPSYTAAWDVYQSQLFQHQYGLPLWNPEPVHNRPEISLGSVIYPTIHGEYDSLFNTFSDAEAHAGGKEGVPVDHEVLSIPQNQIFGPRFTLQTPYMTSKTMSAAESSAKFMAGAPQMGLPVGPAAGLGVDFKCQSDTGAFLVLSAPAVMMHIQVKRRIVTHMRRHFDRWMEYANSTIGLDLKENQIYFVSGTIKTKSWITAAFFNGTHSGREFSLNCDLDNLAEASIQFSHKTDTVRNPEYKWGPIMRRRRPASIASMPAPASAAASTAASATVSAPAATYDPADPTTEVYNPERDQCIFIHYYKMKSRILWRTAVEAAAGPHVLPPGGDDAGASGAGAAVFTESQDEGSEVDEAEYPKPEPRFDPVEPLLEYILANSVAEYAIACDRDLIAIFQGRPIPDNIQAGLEELKPPIDVDETGVGTFSVDVRVPDPEQEMQPKAEASTAQDEMQVDSEAPPAPPPEQSSAQPSAGNDAPKVDTEETSERGEEKRAAWVLTPNAHTSTITAMAVSADSKWAVSGADDGRLIFWDVRLASFHRGWDANEDTVWALAFSPDGTYVASGGSSNKVSIWTVPDARLVATLDGHAETVQMVAWSPDGTRLVSCGEDGAVKMWDAPAALESAEAEAVNEVTAPLADLEGHTALVAFATFSPDGHWLATGGADSTGRIWDGATGAAQCVLRGHDGMLWAGSFDRTSERIATASDDGTVRVWAAESGAELVIIHEHHGPVWGVQFAPDGREVLTASSDATARVCDSFSGRRLLSLEGHDSTVNMATCSPDQEFIATASWDSTIKLWKRSDGSQVKTFNEHNDKVTHVAFTQDGKYLVSGSDDGILHIRAWRDFL